VQCGLIEIVVLRHQDRLLPDVDPTRLPQLVP
jgi:hypothetical protein